MKNCFTLNVIFLFCIISLGSNGLKCANYLDYYTTLSHTRAEFRPKGKFRLSLFHCHWQNINICWCLFYFRQMSIDSLHNIINCKKDTWRFLIWNHYKKTCPWQVKEVSGSLGLPNFNQNTILQCIWQNRHYKISKEDSTI